MMNSEYNSSKEPKYFKVLRSYFSFIFRNFDVESPSTKTEFIHSKRDILYQVDTFTDL